jgi:hypothetical protein
MRITRICANIANDDADKNKLKAQKSPPEADPPLEEKVKTLIISSHCESRPFVNDCIKKQMNFLIAENFVFL